ncbi:MAG: thioredoxin family protein, partial [Planctomycetota bacterium]|nr:thioredoxin family protein [Planctomycetota bacterium]
MLLTSLSLVGLLAVASTSDTTPTCPTPDDTALTLSAPLQHGKVDWFDGTYEELLEKAKKEDRVVLLSFFSKDCGYCKRLDREAFSDDDVVATLEPVLCLSIDAHSETGRVLDEQFPTNGHYPALIFLDPDGSLRDRILGYKPTSYVLELIESILRDEGTLGDLRRQVEAAPEDLDKIWAYARRLDRFDDAAGYAEQVARLRELDPKGTS